MTLNRQFWYVLIAVLGLSFVASFVVTTGSAVRLFEQQLVAKNNDNANVLAQTLSAMEKDATLLELTLAAQFDTGFYQRLTLTRTDGTVVVDKRFSGDEQRTAPAWFARWMGIDAPPATALISDGWQQYGELTVQSQARYAVDALWQRTLHLLVIFLAVAILAAVVGRALLRGVTRPLSSLVRQADAIGEGRYEENPELPKTTDLQRLVKAMNKMALQIRRSFEREVAKLDTLQRKLNSDPLTGVYNRDYLLRQLPGLIDELASDQPTVLVMIDVGNLAEVNESMGRRNTDAWLIAVAAQLTRSAEQLSPYTEAPVTVARLNACEFLLLASSVQDSASFADTLLKTLALEQLPADVATPVQTQDDAHWWIVSERLLTDDTPSSVFMRLDSQITTRLDRGEDTDTGQLSLLLQDTLHRKTTTTQLFDTHQQWRAAFEQALSQQLVSLDTFPVLSCAEQPLHSPLHYEAMMRVVLNGERRRAAEFISWARRLGFIQALELAALEQALNQTQRQEPLAINLSVIFLIATEARAALLETLRDAGADRCRALTLEFTEASVLQHPTAFRETCLLLNQLGCGVGVDHTQHALKGLPDFTELGLRYIKLDRSLVADKTADNNGPQEQVVMQMRDVAAALGIQVIAEGVESEEQVAWVKRLGLDGYTGPATAKNGADD